MSQFEEIFKNVKNNVNFEENARVMQYVGNVLKNAKKPFVASECAYILTFTVSEMQKLLEAIPAVKSYKEKDAMFFYEDSLLMVYTFAAGNANNISEEHVDTIKKLTALVSEERSLENAVDELFEKNIIEADDVKKVLDIAAPVKDEYRRSMLFQGLNEYKEKIKNFSSEAKAVIAAYTAKEMERLVNNYETIGEDAINSLEFAADVCKYFCNEDILSVLEKILNLKINRIRYYALETLLVNGKDISASVVDELANDLVYADLTYNLLNEHGKENLFPKELAKPEYLAKSDMVHWLVYPTELGKEPDEIELLGTAKIKKQIFHIFVYKSDSGNLTDDLHNEWLIGWSGNEGGTFSNFDKLSDYMKKTPQKTVKHIVKKLIK